MKAVTEALTREVGVLKDQNNTLKEEIKQQNNVLKEEINVMKKETQEKLDQQTDKLDQLLLAVLANNKPPEQ